MGRNRYFDPYNYLETHVDWQQVQVDGLVVYYMVCTEPGTTQIAYRIVPVGSVIEFSKAIAAIENHGTKTPDSCQIWLAAIGKQTEGEFFFQNQIAATLA